MTGVAGTLGGVRVLVTRAHRQAPEFSDQLRALGAEVVEIPTIAIQPVLDGARLRGAIERLPDTRLVVFTSANAVRIFLDVLGASHRDAMLRRTSLCAIGSETARALAEHDLQPDLIAGEYTAEGLVEGLRGWDLAGARVLIPRAAAGRDVLPDLLAGQGAEVEVLTLYKTVMPVEAPKALHDLFAGPGVDVATFTSSSTVRNFASAFAAGEIRRRLGGARIACMGPVTAETAAALGLPADIVAHEFTTRGLTAAIAAAYADRLGSR
jgi:uroporphyrinogen III methyltransferase / synthase